MFIHIIHYLYGLSNIKRDEYLIEDCRQVTRFCDSSLLRLKAYQRGKTKYWRSWLASLWMRRRYNCLTLKLNEKYQDIGLNKFNIKRMHPIHKVNTFCEIKTLPPGTFNIIVLFFLINRSLISQISAKSNRVSWIHISAIVHNFFSSLICRENLYFVEISYML